MTLSRVLWVMMRPRGKSITAAIYDCGIRAANCVDHGGEANSLLSALSRAGEGPLEERAAELRLVLERSGWRASQ